MDLLRVLALLTLLTNTAHVATDEGPGIDPHGGPRTAAARCTGDYTGCIDPNG